MTYGPYEIAELSAEVRTLHIKLAVAEKALEDALWSIDNMAAILTHRGIESTLLDPRPNIRAALTVIREGRG